MSTEVLLGAGYAGLLVTGAFLLEWLSAHTHRRSLRFRTAGFTYDETQDHWECPEGQHLWPHEFDHEHRLVRYRAKAHICNGCPRKAACTDSDRGREIVRPLDPWPHSEAGRFHRTISLLMVALAALILGVEVARHHEPSEAALLLGLMTAVALAARWLRRDLRAHPANFPAPAAKNAAGGLLEGALGALSLAGQLVGGALLLLVFLLYILTSGDAIWGWIRDRFSPDRRDRVAGVGRAAWNAASGYIRGISLIALIDTTVITLGMLVIGTPHVGTLALLSFVTLFVPILGAWVSGTVIVLVTLAAVGTGGAVAMAVVILVAQQLDSMFVTPLVYQQTVNLHPIVTLTAVIVGSQLLGIVGAFLAVPMVAVGWSIYKTLEQRDPVPA